MTAGGGQSAVVHCTGCEDGGMVPRSSKYGRFHGSSSSLTERVNSGCSPCRYALTIPRSVKAFRTAFPSPSLLK